MEACYEEVTKNFDPKSLNTYKPFSSAMYGEVSFELIAKLVNHLPIDYADVFLDLGSGIGNVVLQMASCGFKMTHCIGIESKEIPAK